MEMDDLKTMIQEMLKPVMDSIREEHSDLKRRLDELEKLDSESRDDARRADEGVDEPTKREEEVEEEETETGEHKMEEGEMPEPKEEEMEEKEEEEEMAEDEEKESEMAELVALKTELAELRETNNRLRAEMRVSTDLADKPHLSEMKEKLVEVCVKDENLYNEVLTIGSKSIPSTNLFSERLTAGLTKVEDKVENPFTAARELAEKEGISFKEAFAKLSK